MPAPREPSVAKRKRIRTEHLCRSVPRLSGSALWRESATPDGQRRRAALHSLPSLRVSAGWTHGALGGLRGAAVACTSRDLERIEAAVLAAARAHGPGPTRRNTAGPERRVAALIAGRAAVGSRP
ncbi:MAG TPA: hypothetical protein VMQ78_04085 [Candidatus Limnocylindria bacterium]|nr:hypothetical protein [Candidatus Limnocylindria bacterium]